MAGYFSYKYFTDFVSTFTSSSWKIRLEGLGRRGWCVLNIFHLLIFSSKPLLKHIPLAAFTAVKYLALLCHFLPFLAFHVMLYLPLSFPFGGKVVRFLCGSKITALASFMLSKTPPSYLPLAPSHRESVLVEISAVLFVYCIKWT